MLRVKPPDQRIQTDGDFINICQQRTPQTATFDAPTAINGGIVAFVPGATAGEATCADPEQTSIMPYPSRPAPQSLCRKAFATKADFAIAKIPACP
jgi:hypothetical protein